MKATTYSNYSNRSDTKLGTAYSMQTASSLAPSRRRMIGYTQVIKSAQTPQIPRMGQSRENFIRTVGSYLLGGSILGHWGLTGCTNQSPAGVNTDPVEAIIQEELKRYEYGFREEDLIGSFTVRKVIDKDSHQKQLELNHFPKLSAYKTEAKVIRGTCSHLAHACIRALQQNPSLNTKFAFKLAAGKAPLYFAGDGARHIFLLAIPHPLSKLSLQELLDQHSEEVYLVDPSFTQVARLSVTKKLYQPKLMKAEEDFVNPSTLRIGVKSYKEYYGSELIPLGFIHYWLPKYSSNKTVDKEAMVYLQLDYVSEESAAKYPGSSPYLPVFFYQETSDKGVKMSNWLGVALQDEPTSPLARLDQYIRQLPEQPAEGSKIFPSTKPEKDQTFMANNLK